MTIINQITSFKISGFSFNGTDTQLNYTAGVTGGTALPSKALVLNASSNITTGINSLTATSLVSTNLTVNGIIFNSSILNNLSSLDGITPGTAAASKALILDSSRNIININNLTVTNLTGTLQTASQPNVTSVGTLTNLTSNGNLNIAQHNGTSTGLQLNGTLVTSSATELNRLTGLTASTSELNRLTGLTSSTTELNRLTGLTSTTNELNLLSGVTATTNQLNFVSGVTAGAVAASKAIVVNGSRDITNMGSITSTGNFTLSTGQLLLANSINGLSHKYTTGGSAEIITSTNGVDINYIGTSTDNDFGLAVNSIRHLIIKKTTGRIGIGTTSPNQELEVSDLSGNCLRLTNSGGNTYMDVTINNQGIATLTLNGSAPSFNFSHALSTLSNTSSTNTTTGALVVAGGVGIGGSVNVGGDINITGTVTSTNRLTLTTTLGDIITLNNSSSNGLCNLKFNGDTRNWEFGIRNSTQTWPSSFYLFDSTNSALRLLIDSNGNVGLGTGTPTARLDVVGAIRNTTNLLYAQTSTNWTGTSYEGACSSNGIITMTNASVAASGTISLVTANHLNQITLAAQNPTVTTTNATSLYIANAPAAGANMTITNAYALMINAGRTLLNDNTVSTNTTSGALRVTGGVGIGGAVNIGGTLSVTGNITGTLATAAQPNITSVGTLTSLSTGSLTINGTAVTATASELNWLDITSAGTAEASKALVLDSSRDITNINSLTATNLTGTLQTAAQPNITSTGNLTLPSSLTITNGSTPLNLSNTASTSTFRLTIQNAGGHQDIGSFTAHDVSINTNNTRRLTISSTGNVNVTGHNGTSVGLQLNGTLVTATATELNYLDLTTGAGTAEASKALILDSSRNITNINNITLNSTGDAITLSNATTTSRQNIKFISDARTWELGSRGSGASDPDTFYLLDNTNSAMRFLVSSTGNMGIGVSSPAYRLDVSGTINTTNLLRTSVAGQGFSHNDGTINLVSFVNNATNAGIAYFGTATSHALVLQTNNTEHLRISSAGAITTARTFSTSNSTSSTSTTTGALTVTGGVGIGGALNVGASSTIAGCLALTPATKTLPVTPTPVSVTNLLWHSSSSRFYGMRQIDDNNLVMLCYAAGGSYTDYINWNHNSGNPIMDIAAQFLDINGAVGGTIGGLRIGDTTDTTRFISALDSTQAAATTKWIAFGQSNTEGNQGELGFHYTGTGSAANRLSLGFHSNAVISILHGGNVGIGNISPTFKLDVSGTGRFIGSSNTMLTVSSSGNECMIALTATGTSGRNYLLGSSATGSGVTAGSFFVFDSAASASRLTINSNGNIGISTNSPAYKLDITGDLRASTNIRTSQYVFVNDNGNFGRYIGNWGGTGYWGIGAHNNDTIRLGRCDASGVWSGYANVQCGNIDATGRINLSNEGYGLSLRGGNAELVSYCVNDVCAIGSYSNTELQLYQANQWRMRIDGSAAIFRSTNQSSFNTTSDMRLKKDITSANLDNCYSNIKNLRLVNYKWKDNKMQLNTSGNLTKSLLGWIAQEVETVMPNAIIQSNSNGLADCKQLNIDLINQNLFGCVKKIIEKLEIQENNNQTLNTKVEEQNVLIQNLQNENNLLKTQINNILSRLGELEK